VLIAGHELELASALGHCRWLVMNLLLGRVNNYCVVSVVTCVFNRFKVDPLGLCETETLDSDSSSWRFSFPEKLALRGRQSKENLSR
jgi:hypothetical protein